MKIYNPINNGGGNSGSGVSSGDIILSAESSKDGFLNLNYQSYLKEKNETTIKQSIYEPTFYLEKKSGYSEYNVNGEQKTITFKINEDEYINVFIGEFDGTKKIIAVIYVKPYEFYEELSIITFEVNEDIALDAIYNYENDLYIFKNSTYSSDKSLTNKIYKVNIDKINKTVTFDSEIITRDYRIAKAYFNKTTNKFITFEYNNIDELDADLTKSGIYLSDDFENRDLIATYTIFDSNYSSNFVFDISNAHLRLTQNSYIDKENNVYLFDRTTATVDKYTDSVKELFIQCTDKDGNVTPNNLISIIMYEQFNNFIIVLEESYIKEESTPENQIQGYYNSYIKKDLSTGQLSYARSLNNTTNYNFGIVLNNVFNWENFKFGLGVIYYNAEEEKRQVITFNNDSNNNYIYDNVQSIKVDYNTNWHFFVTFENKINYSEVFNNNSNIFIDSFVGSVQEYSYCVVEPKFSSLEFPYVYIPQMTPPNPYVNYLLKE